MKTRTMKLEGISRVEGEGALTLRFQGETLEEIQLRIYEPPRFFEGFLVGRSFREVPDITARICGICPVAHQLSASLAIEKALGIEVSPLDRALRRLIYCGEWIESHALHIHLLHLPDFLDYPDAIRMAADHPMEVERGLRIKRVGNELMRIVGGREIHPVNMRVGGFYSYPETGDLCALVPELEAALGDACDVARWVATLPFPQFEPPTEFVALRHSSLYPIGEGRLASSDGLDVAVEEFDEAFEEFQEPHSHALHCRRRGGGCYQVGPLARLNLNRDRLTTISRTLCEELLPERVVLNPFKSIVARAIETVFALEEALAIVEAYKKPSSPPVEPHVALPKEEAVGHGCTEAPRGICYHRYRIGSDGLVRDARIIPPTSQNQARIEADLREWAPRWASGDDELLRFRCEQAVRNYDPCISCATHRLRMVVHGR